MTPTTASPKPKKKTTHRAAAAGGASSSLVVVESPAKARTIGKYLGKGFRVKASLGHVMDLPKSKLGIEVEEGFKPDYVVIRGKKKLLDELRADAAKSKAVYLATDPDREGEAIAVHIADYLRPKNSNIRRADFNEITEKAVQAAIENAHELNQDLYLAQQTRRVLDRIVGYQISPLLWDKVRRGLSAGRVQSVAVRILCEREAEIQNFKSEEYWTIEAQVEGSAPPPFRLKLQKINGEKPSIPNQESADAILAEVGDSPFVVGSVTKKRTLRRPQPPFITSTLQQEAARKLHFSPSQTMRVAQQLYEGLPVEGQGSVGLITYMRTDSTRSAESAVEEIRRFIGQAHGAEYVPAKPNTFSKKKGAQDAHEAIRPTLLDRPPESLAPFLDENQLGLYRLIWDRFLASQMASAQLDQTVIEVPLCDGKYLFTASGSVLVFPGFLKVYEVVQESDEAENEGEGDAPNSGQLPKVAEGETLSLQNLNSTQHFTQPPSRFSVSSLIRELERRGIGRPSTYASIVTTIVDREYAERIQGYFHPTDLGKLVTDLLIESFPEVLDVAFTAKMEEELDEIAEGKADWRDVMSQFYGTFRDRLETAKSSMRSPKTEEQMTDIECPLCQSKMVVKWGRNGHFLACSNYPECKSTMPYTLDDSGRIVPEELPETDEKCDLCGSAMTVKKGRNGLFIACTNYPECKNAKPIEDIVDGKAVAQGALPQTKEVCAKCQSPMVVKTGRRGPFLACSAYPKCRSTMPIASVEDGFAVGVKAPETDEVCDKCQSAMVVKTGRRGPFLACSNYPRCKNAKPLPESLASTIKKPQQAEKIVTDESCPECGKPMVLRDGRHGKFLACSGYPGCKTTAKVTPEILEKYKKD